MKIKLSFHEKAKEESFLGGDITVFSRSGLNITETLLLNSYKDWRPKEKVLVIENRSSILPLAIKKVSPETEVEIQCFDHFYATQIKERLDKWDRSSSIKCHLGPDLPEQSYDEIYFQVTQSISAEMVADILQASYSALKPEGRLWVTSERQHRHTDSQITKTFGQVSQYPGKEGSRWVIKKKKDLKKIKNYHAEFVFSLPSGLEVQLSTRPGVFSHRRVDEGAQSLAETMEIQAGDKVMELGCGHGGVGLLATKMAENVEVILIDSHTRAIESAKKNIDLNNAKNISTELSASGLPENQKVDVFIGNPPYFSDNAISKLFIDQAFLHLKTGGCMFLVAKSMKWNETYAKELFHSTEVIARRGYKVLKAFKGQ